MSLCYVCVCPYIYIYIYIYILTIRTTLKPPLGVGRSNLCMKDHKQNWSNNAKCKLKATCKPPKSPMTIVGLARQALGNPVPEKALTGPTRMSFPFHHICPSPPHSISHVLCFSSPTHSLAAGNHQISFFFSTY